MSRRKQLKPKLLKLNESGDTEWSSKMNNNENKNLLEDNSDSDNDEGSLSDESNYENELDNDNKSYENQNNEINHTNENNPENQVDNSNNNFVQINDSGVNNEEKQQQRQSQELEEQKIEQEEERSNEIRNETSDNISRRSPLLLSPLPSLVSPKLTSIEGLNELELDETVNKENEDIEGNLIINECSPDDEHEECESVSNESISTMSSNYDSHLTPSDIDNDINNLENNNMFNYNHKKLNHYRNHHLQQQLQNTVELSDYAKQFLPRSFKNSDNNEIDEINEDIKPSNLVDIQNDHDSLVLKSNLNYDQQEKLHDSQSQHLHPSQLQFQQQYMILFNCKICGKGFKHRRSLNRHVKLHTGEKHFKCTYCDTAFARSDHLKAHIRTHNNSKPFKCSICQCGYNTQSALKVHIAHHHHTKAKHKCLNCCKEFDSKYSLDEHVFSVHDVANSVNTNNDANTDNSTNNEDKQTTLTNNSNNIQNVAQASSSQIVSQQSRPTSPRTTPQISTVSQQLPSQSVTPQQIPPPPMLNKTYACKYCSQTCVGEAGLRKHLNEEHSDKILCHNCNTLFRTISDYDLHLRKCMTESNENTKNNQNTNNSNINAVFYAKQQQQQQQQSHPQQSPHVIILPQPQGPPQLTQSQQLFAINQAKRLRYDPNTIQINNNFNKPTALNPNSLKFVQNSNIPNGTPIPPQRHMIKSNIPAVYVANYYGNGPSPHPQLVATAAGNVAQAHHQSPSVPTHLQIRPPGPTTIHYHHQNYCELCNAQFNNSESFHAHMKTHPNYIYTTAIPQIHSNLQQQNGTLLIAQPPPQQQQSVQSTPQTSSHHQIDNSKLPYLANIKSKNDNNSASNSVITISPKNEINSNQQNSPIDDPSYVLRDYCIKEGHYWCAECNLSFSKSNEHLDHMKYEHCVEVYRCVLCKDVQLFDNLTLLKQHFILTHGSKQSETYRCKLCNAIYRQMNEFVQHLKQAHRIEATSPVIVQSPPPTTPKSASASILIPSNKSILHQQLVKQPQHIQTTNGPAIIQAPFVPITPQPVVLNTLKQTATATSIAQYKCAHCNIIFDKEIDFRTHIQQEHENNSSFFKCLYCPSTYLNQVHLDKHIEANHLKKINDNQDSSCILLSPPGGIPSTSSAQQIQLQGAPLKTRYQLLNKQLIPQPQQQQQSSPMTQTHVFKCQICDSLFSREDLLNAHKLAEHNIHTPQHYNHMASQQQQQQQAQMIQQQAQIMNSNGFFCKFCQNSFTNKQQLEKHMRIHLSSIDMKCNICDKHFDNINLLNEHKLVHCKTYDYNNTDIQVINSIQNNEVNKIKLNYSQPSSSSSPSSSTVNANNNNLNTNVACAYCKHLICDEAQYREHYLRHNQKTDPNGQQKLQNCIICRQTINSDSEMYLHINYHLKLNSNKAQNPYQILNKQASVNEQQQQCEMYNCYFCSRILKQSIDEIDYKYDPVTNKFRRLCKLCSTKYTNDKQKQQQHQQQLLLQQQQQQHQQQLLLQQQQQDSSGNKQQLKIGKNKLDHLNDYYYCIIETNESDDLPPLNTNELRCPKCNVKFESWQALTNHYESHKKNDLNTSVKKTFTCIKCQNSYGSEIEIREHVQEHKTDELCELCKSTFHTPAQLESHLLSKHEFPNGIFSCPICQETFAKPDTLFSHTITHGSEGRLYKCHHCKHSFVFKTQLINHLYVHRASNSANAKLNEQEQDQQQKIITNIKQENYEAIENPNNSSNINNVVVTNCLDDSDLNRNSNNDNSEMNHENRRLTNDFQINSRSSSTPKKRKTNDDYQSDADCDEQRQCINDDLLISRNRSIAAVESLNTSDYQKYQNFYETHNSNSNSSTSLLSSSSTPSAKKLNLYNNHKEQQPDRNEFKCVLCDHVFETQSTLQEHFVSIHANESEPEIDDLNKCELLKSTAYNQKNQPKYKKNSKIVPYTHIQVNKSNSKSKDDKDGKTTLSGFKVVAKYFYTCHKCNLDFNSLKVYQQHLLTHGKTPDTNICCHICGKAFANTRNLNVHLRLHTGFRPFECEMCKRKFTRKENLRSHMKCHLGIRPFLCPICSKSFGRKSHVITHLEVHLKSKVHKCNQCLLQFDTLPAYIKHMINQHKSPNEASKEESIKSLKELINDKAKLSSIENNNNSNNMNNNTNQTTKVNSNTATSPTACVSSTNDNYDQQLISLCQEYIELD